MKYTPQKSNIHRKNSIFRLIVGVVGCRGCCLNVFIPLKCINILKTLTERNDHAGDVGLPSLCGPPALLVHTIYAQLNIFQFETKIFSNFQAKYFLYCVGERWWVLWEYGASSDLYGLISTATHRQWAEYIIKRVKIEYIMNTDKCNIGHFQHKYLGFFMRFWLQKKPSTIPDALTSCLTFAGQFTPTIKICKIPR